MLIWSHPLLAQVIEDFDIRYQAQQNGGILFLANTTMHCGSGSNCTEAQEAMPFDWPQDNNNGHNMQYLDMDNDPSTWSSSSDSVSLGVCAEITFAGLYWAGRLGNGSPPDEEFLDQVKISAGSGSPYIDVFADETLYFDASGVDNYCCFADLTDWVSQNPTNTQYSIGNVVSVQGNSSWGGWVLILAYSDALSPMRNLTVFDGVAVITMSGWDNDIVDVPISGFQTPPFGPVDLQLGVIAYDGDRGEGGDQLGFNGNGNFIYIEDETHDINNVFNSTHSTNGNMNPWREPAFNNNLGHDANIFVPDNSDFDFLPNNATDAEIRVTTGGESITVQAITSSIDVYEPDLRATVYIEDLNGGIANPGDILEYTVVGKNIGSDVAVDVYITDTLDIRTQYIPGSLMWVSGPLSGSMTDELGDDPGEFLAADQTIRVRVGEGANGFNGGDLENDPLGADSVAFRFQVELTDDCLLLQCDGTLTGVGHIFGAGDISGNSQTNNGSSALSDANGCPVDAVTTLDVQTGVCPPVAIAPVGTTCLGEDVTLEVPQFDDNPLAESLAQYAWTGPSGFTASTANAFLSNAQLDNAGIYNLEVTFDGLPCLLSTAAYDLNVHVPDPDFTPPDDQCLVDNSFDFIGSGAQFPGATYSWSFPTGSPIAAAGAGVSNVTFNTAGWQPVVLTLEEIGCVAQTEDSVYVEASPDLSAFDVNLIPASGCMPLSVNFSDANPTGMLDYGWSFGDGGESFVDAPIHVYEFPGTYDVTVYAASNTGCPADIVFTLPDAITVFVPPEAGFTTTPQTVSLTAPVVNIESVAQMGTSISYWISDGGSLGSPNGTYTFSDGGTFEIVQTVIDANGCVSTAWAEVAVNGTIFYAPSAFSPDGNGLNDVWQPTALGTTNYAIQVLDRWGQVMWTSDDPTEPWLGQGPDGTHFVEDGVYLWQVRYTDQLRQPFTQQGTLTLYR
ncbi:MAG: PKD domain-containing protein [Flavobacteriales bacterium]